MDFEKLKSKSLTETFIEYVERLIISGDLKVGEKLPPERELAKRTGVSRPVVHESLVKLESKGLVQIKPRHGVYVKDYRTSGSLELLVSLMNYEGNEVEPHILMSLLDLRKLFECEIASLAATHATLDDLSRLEEIIQQESEVLEGSPQEIALIDYRFHHTLALASGNVIYPFIMNSFRPLYKMILIRFYANSKHVKELFSFHRRIVDAILAQDSEQALSYMMELLERSRSYLESVM